MSNIITVKMPDIGEGVVEGEVIEWLKNEGDSLAQDEPVITLMTDKATVELPAPYPGKLVKKYYSSGQKAILGEALYDIAVDELMPQDVETVEQKTVSFKPIQIAQQTGVLATPSVRKIARDVGIDLAQVTGSGKDGRITLDDLKAPATSPKVSTLRLPDDEEQTLSGIRKLMVKKMTAAHDQIPQFSYLDRVEVVRLIQARSKIKLEAEKAHLTLTFMPFFIRALSLTIRHFPILNCSLAPEEDKIIIHHHHNIGIAMSTPQGLIVPVLKDVQNMPLSALIPAYEELKQKAREGKILPSEMKGATISISNFGVLGGEGMWATPIISHPEVAIVAISKIQKQPIVKNDEVVALDVVHVSWSFDHRVIDGESAAVISQYFCSLVKNPAGLL